MTPKLYMIHGSPACRSVFATAKALGITLDTQGVDLAKGEHLSPEFRKVSFFLISVENNQRKCKYP